MCPLRTANSCPVCHFFNRPVVAMLKRILLITFLCAAARGAAATDYTDIWYNAVEPGYGFNIVQSDSFMFVTFFVYGSNNSPTWFTAQVNQDNTGNFNGQLFSTMGTYFAMPWLGFTGGPVGTVSFQPTGPYTARLVYTVTGVATVTANIQRQPLTPITIGGSYTGGLNLSQAGCANAGSGTTNVDIDVTQTPNNTGPASLVFSYPGGLVCTFSGNLTAWGKLYQMASATYTCNGTPARNTTGRLDEIAATAHGIEGTWSAPVEGGCTESGTFSAVLK